MAIGILLGVGGAMAGGALASYAVWTQEKQAPLPLQQTASAVSAAPAASLAVPAAQPVANAVQVAEYHAKEPEYADVVNVDPIKETVRTPYEKCTSEQVVHHRPVSDEHRVAGTVLGGVIGGALGNQVGKGHGRDAATVLGAIAGGYTGNRVQKNMQQGDTYTTSERQCSSATRVSHKTVAYNVTYRWNGSLNTVRMDHRPGDRLPVRDGQVLARNN